MTINGARSPGGGQGGAAMKETAVERSTTLQWQKHCNLTAYLCLGRQRSVWSAASRGERGGVSKRGVETAVMIQGWTHRKTMKCPRLIPWLSSKEENVGQAMAINGARPLGGEQHDPTVRSVAALLTYKLKNGETPPDPGYAAHSSGVDNVCSFYHGDGAVVLSVGGSVVGQYLTRGLR